MNIILASPELIYQLFLLIVRIGAILALLPGFSSPMANNRVKIIIVIMLAGLLLPQLRPLLGSVPDQPLQIAINLGVEALIGSFIGLTVKIIFSASQTAGTIISSQSGLGGAMLFDPESQTQNTPESNLLSIITIILFLTADFHHLIIRSIADSYQLFPPLHFPSINAFSESMTNLVNQVFLIAFKMAAPLLAFGLIFYLANGVLARLIPSLQVFFIMMPLQILVALVIFSLTFSGVMLWYMEASTDLLSNILLQR